jgi:ABC-type polar amino acid transport system ATPase subunit
MVLAEQVHKSFGKLEVLQGIDLRVDRGQVCCLLGPSGSGKSTFLRCINHLEKIDAGRLSVDGELVGYRQQGDKLHELREKETAAKRAEIGMVFQRFNLFPHLTAVENIMLAQLRAGVSEDEALDRAVQLLRRVGLAHRGVAYPEQLSGGEQQRVAIARALALKPSVLLFDEPTSSLDPESTGEVLRVMRELADDGMTMILVTHELPFARDVADRVVFVDAGRVVEEGTPAEVLGSPREQRTKAFLASYAASH